MSAEAQPTAHDTPKAAPAVLEKQPDQAAKTEATAAEPAKAETQPPAEAAVDKEAAKPEVPKEAKVVPDKYDLKLPEDSLLDAKRVESVAAFAKAQGLSNEEAQQVLEADHLLVEQHVAEQKSGWAEQSKNDKEIGGDAFVRNVELSHRVVERFGTPELRKMMDRSGYGNHPEVVRLLVRLGNSMAEDQLVIPGSQAGGHRSVEDKFYGNTTKKE